MSAPHPDAPLTTIARLSAGDVTVGVDESTCIVIWFPPGMTEHTITNVNALVEALNLARIWQRILNERTP